MKRRPRHRSSPPSHLKRRVNGAKKKPNTAHGRPRVPGVAALRHYLKAQGRGSEGRREREAFAKRIGTSLAYLQHLVLGNRQASMPMAARIEAATLGKVRAEELHPSPAWALLREVAQAQRGGA